MDEIKDVNEVLELLESKQYTVLRQRLSEMNEADVAAILEELKEQEMLKVFRILPKDIAADVFSYMEVDSQQYIITSLSEKDAAGIIDNLMADDATDLLEEMPANIVKKLLAAASPDTRRDINNLLRYPEDSAGSIMTVEFVDLKENLTVEQAIQRIRNVGVDSETINICYVLDSRRTLLGTVALRYLLLSQPDEIIGDIMNENVISLTTLMDQEEVAHQFKKYDFTSMPVVDNENRLVGIITVDDVVDIMEQEAQEDIEKMAAIIPLDKPYLKTAAFKMYLSRVPWLLIMMLSATFTGLIITHYESALAANIALVAKAVKEKCAELGVNMCNPILQAELLNEAKTDLNVIMGLCVGHDSLFIKYSDALVTNCVTKDKALAHNPVGALYTADTLFKQLKK